MKGSDVDKKSAYFNDSKREEVRWGMEKRAEAEDYQFMKEDSKACIQNNTIPYNTMQREGLCWNIGPLKVS